MVQRRMTIPGSSGRKLVWLGVEGEDFGLGVGVGDAQERVGDGEAESAGAYAAGVEVEDALAVVDGGLVGVAVKDYSDAGGVGV